MVVIQKPGRLVEELKETAFQMFTANGYRLEEGTKENGVYGIGKAGMTFLVGGLSKRMKFSISIVPASETDSAINFDKAMTGASGGIIGMSKIDGEFRRLCDNLAVM